MPLQMNTMKEEGSRADRRSFMTAGAALFGASAVAGFTLHVGQEMPAGGVSLLDFGARGDGRADDSQALRRALSENRGGTVFAPARAAGYVLGSQIDVPARTRLVFLAGSNQLVYCRNPGPAFILRDASQVDGGDYRGAGGTAPCFVLPDATGQQRLSNIVAVEGWAGPLIDFAASGGSQSRIENFSLRTLGRGDSFAIRIAPTPPDVAVPRQLANGHFNGGPSIDFGGCSVVMIDGVYCADLRFSGESRGVMMTRSRVGNQRRLIVCGHGHLLDAGWMPQLHLAPGTDSCEIRGYFNSGPVIDASGNGRNIVIYPSFAVPLVFTSDDRPIAGLEGATATLSRSGALYRFEFAGTFDTGALGNRMLYVALPVAAPTSAAADQWSPAMLERPGRPGYLPLQMRALPVGAGRQAMIAYRDGAPISGAVLGPGKVRLTGTVSYSA